jgi:hypothetical protein
MAACIANGGSNNACKNMCGIQGANQNFLALNGCVGDFCAVECGG